MDIAEVLRDCDAVLLRPTQSPRLTREILNSLPERELLIATLSVGTDHIPSSWPSDLIISVKGLAAEKSAQAVADHARGLAEDILRRRTDYVNLVRDYQFKNSVFPQSRTLRGIVWMCWGRGSQIRCLLPGLLACGVRKCIIWSNGLDQKSFNECLRNVMPKESAAPNEMRYTCRLGPLEMEVVGCCDPGPYLSEVEVLSLHQRSTPSYQRFIHADFLRRLRRGAIIVNTARGDLVVEKDVVEAMRNGTLAGYAADVIYSRAEETGQSHYSPLWEMSCTLGASDPPVYITPHCGASIQSVLDEASESVVRELLVRLDMKEKVPLALRGRI
jgi:phosphoglycerate dehydrogenase-like enzyme